MTRQFFLALSQNRALRRWMETSSLSRKLTRRFVAGDLLDEGIAVCRSLSKQKMLATLDHLGENVSTEKEASDSRQAILTALDRVAAESPSSTVSIKLTQFGLDISEELCRENVRQLVAKAKAVGSRVEMDMEASEYVDRTLALVTAMREEFGDHVRAVIQAYLYRSEKDIERLNELRVPVRLCKGAYNEPAGIAYPDKTDVDASYVQLTKVLLDAGAYPAIATHDEKIIKETLAYVKEKQYGESRFEFQMLYGVRRDLQKKIVDAGFRIRLYVPYGTAWYPYFMRRLAERP
ncbi:MAG: proline dehydrogenase family protein, partial [Bryobacteraceae bacterium]